jgi:hypothetical protein
MKTLGINRLHAAFRVEERAREIFAIGLPPRRFS